MSRRNETLLVAWVLLCTGLMILLSWQPVSAVRTFNKCRVPPIVSSADKPNVMLLIDFSGSMQFSPYWPIIEYKLSEHDYENDTTYDAVYRGSLPGMEPYDPYVNYYGIFASGAYYTYDTANDWFEESDPTGSVDTQSNSYLITHVKIEVIEFTDGAKVYKAYFKYDKAENPTIAVNDCVIVDGLVGQSKILNGVAFKVVETGTDGGRDFFAGYFIPGRDEFPVNSYYVDSSGTALTRVTGNFSEGISGNFLNWAAMSRMDNTLMALIGGRADCDTDYCYVAGQAARMHTRDTSLKVDIYIRPGTYASSASYDTEAWDNPNVSFNDKVTFLSVSNHYTGMLDAGDPPPIEGGAGTAEVYKLHVDRPTLYLIEVQSPGATEGGIDQPIAKVFTVPAGSHLAPYTSPYSSTQGYNTLSDSTFYRRFIKLNPGDYQVEVSSQSGTPGDYTLIINANVTPDNSTGTHNGSLEPGVGALPFARVMLRKPVSDRVGFIQETFDKVRYGFAHFSNWWGGGNGEGKIEIGCHNEDMDRLINALQRKTTEFDDIVPFYGTPTGQGVWEMSEYFRQSVNSSRNYENNSSFVSKGNEVDPYYVGGSLSPCRRSFVVLLSDGEWNCGVDPLTPAYQMHSQDIRSDIDLDQSVTFYTIYTYAQDDRGQNSMKEIAMYGGFQDLDNNDYPYTANRGTSLPGDSRNLDWPLKGCSKCITGSWCPESPTECLPTTCCPFQKTCSSGPDCGDPGNCGGQKYDSAWAGPNGQYNSLCAEWAFQRVLQEEHEDTAGNPTGKFTRTVVGIPRNFYMSENGQDIGAVLTKIIAQIESAHAAAGAVATVSQEIRGRDLVLRGVFQAVDENHPEMSVWYGHLESYFPYDDNTYRFEKCCATDKLCYQDAGTVCSGETDDDCPEKKAGFDKNCQDFAQTLTPTTTRRIFAGFDLNNDGRVKRDEVKDFTTANAADFLPKLELTVDFDCDSDGSYENDPDDAVALINWVHGQTPACYRDRADTDDPTKYGPWLLGDIAYSTPVIVGIPGLGAVSVRAPDVVPPGASDNLNPQYFYGFRNKIVSKMWAEADTLSSDYGINIDSPTEDQLIKRMVYVGANDGMLHAFIFGVWDWRNKKWLFKRDATDTYYGALLGKELWAYIPSNVVPTLKQLALKSYGNVGCKHRTTVDLSPEPWQVLIDHDGDPGTPREWRTVIIGGERGGGDVFFCIDVTNPDSPILLWEYSVLKNLVHWVTQNTNPWQYNGGRCNETNRTNFCQRCVDNCTPVRPPPGRDWENWCQYRVNWCLGGTCDNDIHDRVCGPQSIFDGYRLTGLADPDPYDNIYYSTYTKWRDLPMTWSRPYVGRLASLDGASVTLYTGNPDSSGNPTGPFPDTASGSQFNGSRFVAFMGGGFRYFDSELDSSVEAVDLKLLRQLHLLAVDVETGENLFKYVWAGLRHEHPTDVSALFPLLTRDWGQVYVPYAISDPLGLDVWNRCKSKDQYNNCIGGVGDDGFVDRIYVGDLTGNLYGIKFNFDTGNNRGIRVDVWLTKAVDESDSSLDEKWSKFRSEVGQPITVQPAATMDGEDSQHLRVIFGAGKYDDVVAGGDDKTDPAKTSLYNLRDVIDVPDLEEDTGYGGEVISGSGLYVRIKRRCGPPSATARLAKFDTGCTWTKSDGSADCCEKTNSTCSDPCWECVYDLVLPQLNNPSGSKEGDPGERLVNKSLIAGGLVFVTSYLPASDPCAYLGQGFLYIFHYMCKDFPTDFNPLEEEERRNLAVYFKRNQQEGTNPFGLRLALGAGLPSEPILDSAGEHIIVQLSTGEIVRIKVDLLEKALQVKGWKEIQ